MKVGDLVSWYCPVDETYDDPYYEEDLGIITRIKRDPGSCQIYIMWQSGEGTGWFDDSNPNIGVLQ